MPASALSLPPEVLCVIFSYMSLSYDREQSGISIPESGLGWVASCTHVCRKWRRAALGFPQLWADNICFLESNQATECFLERAESMPLTVRTSHHLDSQFFRIRQWPIVRKYLPRVHVFEQPQNGAPVETYWFLAKDMLSCMKVLRLHVNRNYPTPLQDTLLAPVLRELYLTNIACIIQAPQLHVLSMIGSDRFLSHSGISTIQVILDALKDTPLLEQLTVDGMSEQIDFAAGRLDSTRDDLRVELAHLKRLHLAGDSRTCRLYRNIRAPATADITVNLKRDYKYDGTPFSSRILLATMEHHLLVPDYDMLIVREEVNDEAKRFAVCLRSSASSRSLDRLNDEQKWEGRPEFNVRIRIPKRFHSLHDITEVISSLAQHLNAGKIKFLDVGDIGLLKNVGADEVGRLLLLFPNVATLQIDGQRAVFHTQALKRHRTDGDLSNKLQLPVLQHLIVQGISPQKSLSMRHVQDFRAEWMVILDILEERQHTEHPIRFLTLAGWANVGICFSVGGKYLEEFEEVDKECLLRAEGLVERVFDTRVQEDQIRLRGFAQDERRITKYAKNL